MIINIQLALSELEANFYLNDRERNFFNEFLKENYSKEGLVDRIIEADSGQYSYMNGNMYRMLEESLEIHGEDVQGYYRRTGKIPDSYKYYQLLSSEFPVKTYNEVLDEICNLKITENELVPIDIDRHKIEYNERLDLPEHNHFDFRYLFTIDKIAEIKLDVSEHGDYKWIGIDEMKCNKCYEKIVPKIEKILLQLDK